jgi:uncharacterized protein YndB with AHSA1/START domain
MQESAREILVPAGPDETWEAITDPEQLREWLGRDAEVELEPGGELAIELEGEGERRGFFEEIDAPRRLVFWWSAEDAEASRVEIELEPEPAGTRVRVVESRPLALLDVRGSELPGWSDRAAAEPPRGPELSARALCRVT